MIGLFGACAQCHRKVAFEVLPDAEKQLQLLSIVPPRFIEAELEHLPEKLLGKIKTLPEDTGLMLWGAPGVGKSYSMAAIAKDSIRKGYLVLRINYEMLCLRIRDTFKTNSQQTEYGIIEQFLTADKLFIEDIGTTKSEGKIESGFSVRTLLVLLDYRLENCLPTFVTTNRPVEELGKTFDERIASRLIQSCVVVKLSGDDKRGKQLASGKD